MPTMDTPMTPEIWRRRIGKHIKDRRLQAGYPSARQAAVAAKISEGSWRQLESGKRQIRVGEWEAPNPALNTQEAIAEVLSWPSTWLGHLLGDGPVSDLNVTTPTRGPVLDHLGTPAQQAQTFSGVTVAQFEDLSERVSILERAMLRTLAEGPNHEKNSS